MTRNLRDWRYHSVTHSLYCHQLEGLEVSLSYTRVVLKHYHQPEGLEVSLSYTQFVLKHCHQPEGLEVSLSYTQFVLSSARGTGGITQLHTVCIEALSSGGIS